MWACPNSDDNNTSTRHIWVCLLGDGAHPWQLAQSSSSTDTSSKAVRMLRVTIKISCPLPSHDATPVEAAVPDPTTPASGPHHTPLSTGAMAHHTVGEEDIGLVPAGETREKQNFFCRCEITITFKPKQNYLFFTVLPGMTYIVDFFMFLNVKKNLCSVFFFNFSADTERSPLAEEEQRLLKDTVSQTVQAVLCLLGKHTERRIWIQQPP